MIKSLQQTAKISWRAQIWPCLLDNVKKIDKYAKNEGGIIKRTENNREATISPFTCKN